VFNRLKKLSLVARFEVSLELFGKREEGKAREEEGKSFSLFLPSVCELNNDKPRSPRAGKFFSKNPGAAMCCNYEFDSNAM
jgi:hypothetical protein